jgi:CRISPR-associated protein Cas5t
MQALHVCIEGLSASYAYPFIKTGTQISLPTPPFSSILGNLSACAGRVVGPSETLIGFEFSSTGRAVDLERTRRLQTDKKTGRLSENAERGIAKREFHVRPMLHLYLTEVALEGIFERPAAAPCLGRSQDIGWIRYVRRIELEPRATGELGPTVVRFPNAQVGGLILPPLADYYLNETGGYVREVGRFSRYQFTPKAAVREQSNLRLYHPTDSQCEDRVVVLHDLSN